MRHFRGYFSVVAVLLALACAPWPAQAGQGAGDGFAVDERASAEKAPGFTLPDLEGGEAALADFRGRVAVVHFWASWCGPCRREFPALEALAERFGGRGLVVIAVAADSRERVGRFVADVGVDTAKVRVLVDRYGSVTRSYGVGVLPVSVVVDRRGRIAGVAVGERDYASAAALEYFEGLLADGGRRGAGPGQGGASLPD